jgi:O-antigen/teichoic acid export membrane protein
MTSPPITLRAANLRALTLRFAGYLSADGLNYALGFIIYGLLIRVLSDAQYGRLSVATAIYQALMMFVALGLDLTGPAMLAKAGESSWQFIASAQRIRVAIAVFLCLPILSICGLYAWHREHSDLAALMMASFLMVLARAFDLTYVAVAFRMPGLVAKTRLLGLLAYLLPLAIAVPLVREHIWLIPALNALGVTFGRIQLARVLRRQCSPVRAGVQIPAIEIVSQGMRAGFGQLLLLVLQTMDVVLLAKYATPDVVGQYGMVSRLYLFGTAVLVCLLNTFLPELVSAFHTDRFRSYFGHFWIASVLLGISGGIAFYAFSVQVAALMAHRPLSLVHAVSPLFALVFFFVAIANPFLNILPSIGRSTAYLLAITSAAGLLVTCDLFLMPRWGAVGAAAGQVVATAYLAVFSIVQVYAAGGCSATPECGTSYVTVPVPD